MDVVFDLKDSKLGFSIILGCPLFQSDFNCKNPNRGYQGCLRLLFINNHQVNFLQIQQESLSNFNQISFDVCNIQDRSVFPIDFLVFTKVSYLFFYYSLCMSSNTVCNDHVIWLITRPIWNLQSFFDFLIFILEENLGVLWNVYRIEMG